MNLRIAFAAVSLCAVLSACTEPRETTAVGAATGGVLGAGLGAIVGNQTGSPGAGLTIGALAGASAGAAIGNALQAQQEAIRTQDEAIERQEKLIRAQNSELDDLRRYKQETSDNTSFSTSRSGSSKISNFSSAADERASLDWKANLPYAPRDARTTASKPAAGLSEKTLTTTAPVAVSSAAEPVARMATPNKPKLSADCQSAQKEVDQGKETVDASKKLFHYRRALRLCPEDAALHNDMGEIYIALKRKDDARFEFNEALRLDPQMSKASTNLQSLNTY